MKTYILLFALPLAVVSCNFGGDDSPAATTTPNTTELDGTALSAPTDTSAHPNEVAVAELPAGSEQQEYASQGVSVAVAPGMTVEDLETFLLVCSNQVVKDARCFTLERYGQTPNKTDFTGVTLKGRPFYYSQKPSGANQELQGYLQMGSQWYLVKAIDKDPTWIFPYLAHVELRGAL